MSNKPPNPQHHHRADDAATRIAIQQSQRRGHMHAALRIQFNAAGALTLSGQPPSVLIGALVNDVEDQLGLILHSSQLLVLGDKGDRGERVIATTPLFWKILQYAVEHGPQALHKLLPPDGRMFEELIAGVYRESGYEIVDLSAQSGDGGVDVWAKYELPICGSITVLDQAKLYAPDRSIQPGDVFRIFGAGNRGAEFSKAVVSTTGRIPDVVRREVKAYGENVVLRDSSVLKSELEKLLRERETD